MIGLEHVKCCGMRSAQPVALSAGSGISERWGLVGSLPISSSPRRQWWSPGLPPSLCILVAKVSSFLYHVLPAKAIGPTDCGLKGLTCEPN